MSQFSHLDADNNPGMVDVGHKDITKRTATARTFMFLGKDVMAQLEGEEINMPKGPVFQTAIIAGTMAVKRTWDLIPLCHPLALTGINFKIEAVDEEHIQIDCTVKLKGKTGVEMEALTGCSVAALTVYDMCKALSQKMVIKDTRLVEKKGGKSDFKLGE
ncbi:MAG: cyclic pyranopterin monophosphate synthase MoaC [Bacteroidota bacterium]